MTDTITKAKEFLAAIRCQDSTPDGCDWCGYARHVLPNGNLGGLTIQEWEVNNEVYFLCNTCIRHTRTRVDVLRDNLFINRNTYYELAAPCKYGCSGGGYEACEHTFAWHCLYASVCSLEPQDDAEYWHWVDDVALCEALTSALERSIKHKEKRDSKSTN